MQLGEILMSGNPKCIFIFLGPFRLPDPHTYLDNLSESERCALETLWKNKDFSGVSRFLDMTKHKQRGIIKGYLRLWYKDCVSQRKYISKSSLWEKTREVQILGKNSEGTMYTPGFKFVKDKDMRIRDYIEKNIIPQFLDLPNLDLTGTSHYNSGFENLKTYISFYYMTTGERKITTKEKEI